MRAVLIILGVIAGIILLSNLSRAFQSKVLNDRLYVFTYEGRATLQEVVNRVPGTAVLDASSNLVQVPAGKTYEFRRTFILKDGVRSVMWVSSPPSFSFAAYKDGVIKQIKDYTKGNFGDIQLWTSSKILKKPVQDYLRVMLETSLTYFIPGLLTGVFLGYTGAVLGALRPGLGRFFDGAHGTVMGIPDFFIVTMLQLLGIYLVKWTDHQVYKILQYNDGTPFLIPFVVIAVFPAVLVYGTLRIAIRRELGEGYVPTGFAKGLSFRRIIGNHILRNTTEDVLSVMPKAISVSLGGMVIAETMCHIVGIGGYYMNPKFMLITSLTATSIVLGGIALLLQFVLLLLRKWLVVGTREASK